MQIIEALFLGLLQGLTEFIPVSSSGHLVLAEEIFNTDVGGLFFDVMLHLGTLVALVAYFRDHITQIARSVIKKHDYKLASYLVIGTIPAVILGVLLEPLAEDSLRSVGLVVFNLVAVSVLMLLVEKMNSRQSLSKMTRGKSLLIGTAQALALFPGVSRSGITIVGGMALRFKREAAARFAFLLAIPVTFGAVVKQLVDGGTKAAAGDIDVFLVGVVAAAASGYWAIRFLLKYLAKHSLNIFAYYRLALAAIVLMVVLL